MQLVFLPSARNDLAALRRYFRDQRGDPLNGLQQARHRLTARVSGRIGNGPLPGLREMPIPRTPFRIICRFQDDRVEVLAITDDRSDPE